MLGLNDSRHYSQAFKEKVIQEINSGSLTKEKARIKYGIGGKSTILKWIRKLDKAHQNRYFIVDKKDRQIYEKKIKLLEKQLELEKMKRIAAETMIDIAENELKLPIRKKFATKQSKK